MSLSWNTALQLPKMFDDLWKRIGDLLEMIENLKARIKRLEELHTEDLDD